MINYQTILSNYNKRGTLLKWLRTLQTALEEGALETVTTSTTEDSVVFHFGFADGTSVDSPPIQLEAGPQGPEGPPGSPGAPGQDGEDATIEIGTVTTLSPGSDATVTNSGTPGAAVFNFGIPKGDPGSATATPIDNITDDTVTTVTYSSGVATIEKDATVEYTDQSSDSITNTTLLPISPDGGHLNIAANNGSLDITDPVTDQIIPIEATSTASRAYASGQYFINSSGVLVYATADIALGATIDSTNTAVVPYPFTDAIKSDINGVETHCYNMYRQGTYLSSADLDLTTLDRGIYYCTCFKSIHGGVANAQSDNARIVVDSRDAVTRKRIIAFCYDEIYWRTETAANTWSSWSKASATTVTPIP